VLTQPSAPAASASAPAPEPTSSDAPVAPSSEDDWKTEYEEHLVEWRARSAEQRQKAEAERAKWETVRAEKEKAGVDWKDSVLEERRRSLRLSESMTASSSVSGWENVRAETEGGASPSPADARDLVTGETPRHGQVCLDSRSEELWSGAHVSFV
jgi:type IV secretory pathway VirB10-like protein